MSKIPESELILNSDNSVYHLNLLPHEISDTIINVGDPDRVKMVSDFFDSIEVKKQKREFVTHTGHYKNKRITVLSTGISDCNDPEVPIRIRLSDLSDFLISRFSRSIFTSESSSL